MTFFLRMLTGSRIADPTLDATTARNIRYLYLEIVFAGVLGAIVTFHAAFIVRLGGTKELVALLSSIPALVSAVFSIPSARLLARLQNRKRWIFGSLLFIRIGTGFIALLPLIFPNDAAAWLVAIVIFLSLPSIFFTNGFQALLADVIPERQRAVVFSTRQIIWAAGIVITSALAGIWLDNAPFPINYQLMYAFGFIVSLGSQHYLNRIIVPESHALPTTVHKTVKAADIPKAQLNADIGRMLFNMLIYQAGLTLPGALFTVYYIEELGALDSWLGFNSAIGFAGMVVGNLIWVRLLRRRTYSWAMRTASLFTWLFPVGIALFPDLTAILLINLFVNMIHPGMELGSLNVMFKLGAGEHRAIYMSWYNTVLNISFFAAPLAGVWLASQFSIPVAMLIAGALRFAGGVLFNVNRVREPSREAGAVVRGEGA
ncbi:MAG: MFS transporter [Chloroflexi bacterium CFX4]|nr:MFS transporter [Chloroflexi bacterium CFX4]MDL1921487.1 MFS transporter [Chloroflexi bacterium CFX3]